MILSFVIFFIIYLIIWETMKLSFKSMNDPIRAIISGGLTAIFSPRVANYKSKLGDKLQLDWPVLKKSVKL